MPTWVEMVENLRAIDFKAVATALNEKHEDAIVKDVQGQLWDGQYPDGSDIRPSYLEDTFFKTRRQAEAYAAWKQKITPNSQRNKYAPNLFINGYFYSTIRVQPAPELKIISSWKEVEQKYQDALGLSLENGSELLESEIRPDFNEIVERATGLTVN